MKWKLLLGLFLAIAFGDTAHAQYADSWASADFLMWWIDDGPAPVPLVSMAPADSTSTFPGALGNPDTTVLLGGSQVDYPLHFGGRFTIGRSLSMDRQLGIEANYLFLGKRTESNSVANDGTLFLTNPFLEAGLGPSGNVANYLATPGGGNSGSATLTTSHELQGFELNALRLSYADPCDSWSWLAGYRFLYVGEDLTLRTTQNDDVLFFVGQFVDTFDQFETRNYFNGGQIGLRRRWNRGAWSISSTFKFAMGSTHEVLKIRGSSTTNTGEDFLAEIPVTTVPGGIYAQPTNIGKYDRDRFAVLPEVALQLGFQVSPRVRLLLAYDFLYLSELARPGIQIDGSINSTQLVSYTGVPAGALDGDARPRPRLESTDYWAQGINFGAELAW
jgi:hypothetical protein